MSGHWRFYVTALLLSAGLLTLPAYSNPLTDLFNGAPQEQAAAPARVQEASAPARAQCVLQPGKSTAPRRHWVYHIDGHRKCWFEADQASVSAKKPSRHHMVRRPAAAPEENEVAQGKNTVLDARAQLLSAAPAGAPDSATSAPELADTSSARAREPVIPLPEAPIAAQPAIDPLTPDRAARRAVDVETLLAASTVDRDAAASSVSPPTADATSTASADNGPSTATWAGALLIALGFVFLAGPLLAGRLLGLRETLIPRA